MTLLREAPRVKDSPSPDAEDLIEEARRHQRRRWRLVGATTVLVIAGLVSFLAKDDGNQRPVSHPTRATSSSLPFVNGKAFRGYGDLAFVSVGQLFVLNGTNDKLTSVTTADAQARNPAFSPNKKWLAYAIRQTGAGIARAEGGSPRIITLTGGSPRWLPNGELLIGDTTYRISKNDSLRRSGSVPSGLVAWSSDGSRYAFVTRDITHGLNGSFHGVESLQLAASLTGQRTVWHSTPFSFEKAGGFHGGVVNGVIVLPHQEGVLYWIDPDQSDAADGMHLYEIRSPGAVPVDLGVTVGENVSTSAGGVLAIGSGGDRYAWMTKTVKTCAIATASCSAVQVPNNDLAFDPRWSPNGRDLAFIGAPSSKAPDFFQSTLERWYSTHRLWVLEMGSSRPIQIPGTSGASVPVWSSDSRSLLYVAGDSLFLIAKKGAQPVKVASPLFSPSAWPSYYGQIQWDSQFSWSAS